MFWLQIPFVLKLTDGCNIPWLVSKCTLLKWSHLSATTLLPLTGNSAQIHLCRRISDTVTMKHTYWSHLCLAEPYNAKHFFFLATLLVLTTSFSLPLRHLLSLLENKNVAGQCSERCGSEWCPKNGDRKVQYQHSIMLNFKMRQSTKHIFWWR